MVGFDDSRGFDPDRATCEELAERLATADGQRLLRLLQMAGLLNLPSAAAPAPGEEADRADAGGDGAPPPIRVWRPREVDGRLVFERPPPGPFGDHYADTPRLEAAKPPGVRRVVWLGESAAAGYLYAPAWTPAKVLAGQLEALTPGRFEIVDLARTNDRLASLAAATAAAEQLRPDVFAILAGNNWTLLETPEQSPLAPGVRARQAVARALRAGGLRGARAAATRALERVATAAWDTIAASARRVGADLVVAIPEVDVLGWPAVQPVHHLRGDGVARWYAGLEDARRALADAEPARALQAIEAMQALDEGLCATSHRLRARALGALGRSDEAAAAARAAIDAVDPPSLAFLGVPQATSAVRASLARLARRHGATLVDLPRIFAEHTGRSAPDRRLFVDYCHFDAEGTRVVAAALAAALLGEGRSYREVLARVPAAPEPAVEATARVGAALHTAHRLTALDPAERAALLDDHLRRALDADPTVVETLAQVVRARATPAPAVLTRAQADNLAGRHRLTLQHGWRWDHLDAEVLEAIARVAPGVDVTGGMLRGLGLRPGEEIDLSRPPWLAEPLQRLYPEAMGADPEPRAYLRAVWPETSFWLLTAGEADVELTVVARRASSCAPAPEAALAAALAVRLEGETLASLPLGAGWARHRVHVGADRLRRGLVRIVLRWPMPAAAEGEPLAACVERLELGLDAPLHPVFGELFALRARLAGPARATNIREDQA